MMSNPQNFKILPIYKMTPMASNPLNNRNKNTLLIFPRAQKIIFP